MMGYGGYGYGMMGYGWGWIMMLGILIIVVLIIFALVRYLQHSGNISRNISSNNPSNRAIDILNERYARGEISDDEYKRKKAEIKA